MDRCTAVAGYDVQLLNQHHWHPGYFGANLASPSGSQFKWKAVSGCKPVFGFDFRGPADALLQHQSERLQFDIVEQGVCNAVIFWFDLKLDAHSSLSTSPHNPSFGISWQQAVQFLPEQAVQAGDKLQVTASHDTYGISFQPVDEPDTPPPSSSSSSVAFFDPVWRARYTQLEKVSCKILWTV